MNAENVDFDITWGILESALKEIHSKNASTLSFEQLYRNAYKLVLKKKGEKLYHRVRDLEAQLLHENIQAQVAQAVTPILISKAMGEQLAGQTQERRADGERFLRVVKEVYLDHHICMNMITDVLMYMVRTAFSAITHVDNDADEFHARIGHTVRTNRTRRYMPPQWLSSELLCSTPPSMKNRT